MNIYIATKVKHAQRFKELELPPGCRIISSWLAEAGLDDTIDWPDLWRRCVHEASTCDLLLFYTETEDTPKGALAEAGAALAHHKPVLIVGPITPALGSFYKHSLVTQCHNIGDALKQLAVYQAFYTTGYEHAVRKVLANTPSANQ